MNDKQIVQDLIEFIKDEERRLASKKKTENISDAKIQAEAVNVFMKELEAKMVNEN